MKIRNGLRATLEIAESESSSGILQEGISELQPILSKYLDSVITDLRNIGSIVNYSDKSSGSCFVKTSK
ncbi:MAG: hypothetical protein Q8J84_10750 [Flavobacteriaceae bacterium]|nr:hypothetical protein [Flavobacteriaceae bacterium]